MWEGPAPPPKGRSYHPGADTPTLRRGINTAGVGQGPYQSRRTQRTGVGAYALPPADVYARSWKDCLTTCRSRFKNGVLGSFCVASLLTVLWTTDHLGFWPAALSQGHTRRVGADADTSVDECSLTPNPLHGFCWLSTACILLGTPRMHCWAKTANP